MNTNILPVEAIYKCFKLNNGFNSGIDFAALPTCVPSVGLLFYVVRS